MANWQGFSLTEKGFALQAKINAGKTTLKFTKISIGSGVAGNGVPSDLVQKEKDLTIGSITPEGQLVKIVTTLTNEGVQKAFKEREMGLYAQDPNEGKIMYAYMIDQDPDTLPAEGSTTVVSKRLTLALTFSNTGNVTAVLDSKQLLTFGDLETKADDETGASTADNKAVTPAWVQNLLSTFTNFKTSQITDFTDGLIKKLALTTTIGAINALQTNSWFGQLLKMVLNASGVKYNIAQNGYMCLGDFFGGLIIQWGSNKLNLDGQTHTVPFSIPISYAAAALCTMRSSDFVGYVACPYWSECTQTTISITTDYETGQGYVGTSSAIVTWVVLAI